MDDEVLFLYFISTGVYLGVYYNAQLGFVEILRENHIIEQISGRSKNNNIRILSSCLYLILYVIFI